jgi:MFS family permease
MHALLQDSRVRRLLLANTLGSIGSGVTIFAVPWLLVRQPEGNVAFRWATVGTTLVLLLLTPLYGAWLDRHSRKTALLAGEAWGFCATAGMALAGGLGGGFSTVQLMAVYFAGMVYYSLHYPAKFAFVQQTLPPSQYQSLMGLLEVQGQTAMMIAGALGGILVDRAPLWVILAADAGTYLASFLIQATLPYAPTHLKPAAEPPHFWRGLTAGVSWLGARPRLAVLLTCTLMPFVVVMSGNYLFPIYVSQTLQAGALTFAGGEMAFAAGAIVAGLALPRLLARHSAAKTLPATMLIFLAGMLLLLVLRVPAAFIIAAALIGCGNAGCRVARSALLLRVVPQEVMGRVSSFYQILDRLLRTALVLAMAVIDTHGPPAGYLLLTAVLVLALVGVLRTRRSALAAGDIH